MKVLYFHQYFSTPSGAVGSRSYEMASAMVNAGHQVQMVCLRHDLTNTGNRAIHPWRRCGLVDGIEVIEYDLPYSNHAGLAHRHSYFSVTA